MTSAATPKMILGTNTAGVGRPRDCYLQPDDLLTQPFDLRIEYRHDSSKTAPPRFFSAVFTALG